MAKVSLIDLIFARDRTPPDLDVVWLGWMEWELFEEKFTTKNFR